MRLTMLAAAGALAAIAVPASAQAQDWSAIQFAPGPTPRVTQWNSGPGDRVFVGKRDGGRRHDRRNRDGDFVPWGWNSGEWAYYNNRSFNPDSYNDWWHDRPDRAFPRWMQTNPNCARLWWSGGGWRC